MFALTVITLKYSNIVSGKPGTVGGACNVITDKLGSPMFYYVGRWPSDCSLHFGVCRIYAKACKIPILSYYFSDNATCTIISNKKNPAQLLQQLFATRGLGLDPHDWQDVGVGIMSQTADLLEIILRLLWEGLELVTVIYHQNQPVFQLGPVQWCLLRPTAAITSI